MSKNDLYNSMNRKAPLSKKEIGDHLSGNAKINEADLDAFEKDALDGWTSTGTAMNTDNIDKRFISKGNKRPYIWSAIAILVTTTFLLIYYNQQQPSKELHAKINENQMVEETDLFIAEKFDTLIETKETHVVEVKLLQKHQEQDLSTQKPEQPIATIQIDELPLLDVNPDLLNKEIKLERKRRIKEVYFSNFKLVDYRVLRSKPTIATKQLDLTGTAANRELKGMDNDEPVWRKVEIPYIDFIKKSMYQMEELNFKKALARFEVILDSYPDDINALFYSGFAFYNLGEHHNAIHYFSKALKSDIANFDEEALWYLGLSYEKIGDQSKANEIFRIIISSDSYYTEEAQKRLKAH